MTRYYINKEWQDDITGDDIIFSIQVPDQATYDKIMQEITMCKTSNELYTLLKDYEKIYE